MSFHFGQAVEAWTGREWVPGVVTVEGSQGQYRVELPDADGDPIWVAPFYIRPREAS